MKRQLLFLTWSFEPILQYQNATSSIKLQSSQVGYFLTSSSEIHYGSKKRRTAEN